jgi:hypothetical protein
MIAGFTLVAFLGCAHTKNTGELKNWQFIDLEVDYQKVDVSSKDSFQITKLIDLYATKPYEASYNKITFKTLRVDHKGNRYFIFDVDYVDDMGVVFVCNDRYEIENNFLVSNFQ